MSFKKHNINKSSPAVVNIIRVISLFIIFLLWFFFIKNISFFNFETNNKITSNDNLENTSQFATWVLNKSWSLSEKIITSKKTDEIKSQSNKIKTYIQKKESKDKINILLAWRWWGSHDAPNLTDTIILVSIDTKSKIISMLSIPRDLYVEYPDLYNVNDEKWKINWLYAKYSFKSNSQKVWMKVLENKITQITWEKIDYFVNIDFNWFTKIIDTIWGIEITIPEQFVDNRYPDSNWGYKTLVFKKWTWIFDGENALKYARSRHSTSDFDRSIRQQQVIKAIKNKLTWSYFFKSPWKIKELYWVFNKYLYTDIKLSTLLSLAYTLNWASDYNIISSNINDSCFYWSNTCSKWWFLYTPNRNYFGWASVLLAEWTTSENLNNYSKLQKYTNVIFNYPELFKENYKINIFNSLKVNHLAWALSNEIVRYWFNIPQTNSIWNTDIIYNKSTILYNWISEKSATIKLLKQLTNAVFIKTDFPKYSKDWANIEIIIWEDYLSDNNPFKF